MKHASGTLPVLAALVVAVLFASTRSSAETLTLGGREYAATSTQESVQGRPAVFYRLEAVGSPALLRAKFDFPLEARLRLARPVLDDLAALTGLAASGLALQVDSLAEQGMSPFHMRLVLNVARSGVVIDDCIVNVLFDSTGAVQTVVSRTREVPVFSVRHLMTDSQALAFAVRGSGKPFNGTVYMNRPVYVDIGDSTFRVCHRVIFGTGDRGHGDSWQVLLDPQRKRIVSSATTAKY